MLIFFALIKPSIIQFLLPHFIVHLVLLMILICCKIDIQHIEKLSDVSSSLQKFCKFYLMESDV